MKKIYFSILFALFTLNLIAQEPFITKWQVYPQDLSITIPTIGTGYDYTVDFGDGTVLTNVTGNAIHSYNIPGIYTISIAGDFPRIYFESSSSFEKIKSVEQWGDNQWQSMEGAFTGCVFLVLNATDIPDLSQVISLQKMFKGTSINSDIESWNVSNVVDMSYLFAETHQFNQPLNNWDVSNVTDMKYMFSNASNFDQPLDNWNTSNVIDMRSMFGSLYGLNTFNQPIDSWDTSNVTDMSNMFGSTYGFNYFDQPINSWNVSNVTDMSRMFMSSKFNQPLDNWDVSNVVNMESMFGGNSSPFNQPIAAWDVSNVINMSTMFMMSNFNQPLNDWDVSNVIDMSGMFASAEEFNQPLNNWDVSSVTNMRRMFRMAVSFNQPLNEWDVSSVTNMEEMFIDSYDFNRPLDSWDVSNVTTFNGIFRKAFSFNQPLNNWDISNATDLKYMFYRAESFNQNFIGWDFNSFNLSQFVSQSGLDIPNYESLLSYLASLESPGGGRLGAEGLEYCNDSARDYLVSRVWTITGDTQSEECNLITGIVTYDEDNNGCNPNDIGITGFMVNATDGNRSISTFSSNGNYFLGTIGTSFTVSLLNIPEFFISDPTSVAVTFITSNIEQADFCVIATQVIEDLSITLLPLIDARPGFETDYQLVVENRGTQIVPNVGISLVFDDEAQTFLNASPSPISNTANELTFEFENLVPFGHQVIEFTMQTFEPPIVNGGDILIFTADVTPNENDYTPENNTFVYEQTVVNSFDPNDKQVLQGEEIYMEEADEYLDYLIRFQNTGTASAINVRILDTLHPKLDWTTIRPLNASHNYHIEITDGNQVAFIFNDIDLPHEDGNEPESHGFIAYKIKPKSDVQVGDVITGNASIFFDFNEPIITNMVSTEIVDRVVSTEDYTSLPNQVILYPNPADSKLNLRTTNGIHLQETAIYNLQGQKMNGIYLIDTTINIENLASGMYLLKIQTNLGIINRSFIKM